MMNREEQWLVLCDYLRNRKALREERRAFNADWRERDSENEAEINKRVAQLSGEDRQLELKQ